MNKYHFKNMQNKNMKKIFFTILSFSITVFLKSEPSDLYEKLLDSTVRINIWENYDDDELRETVSVGSGVFLNKVNGKIYILTNAHVLLDKYVLFDGEDIGYDDSLTMVVDTTTSVNEYVFIYEDILYWQDADIAIIVLDTKIYNELSSEIFVVPEIYDGYAPPLLEVYVAGFPWVSGNYADYNNIFVDKCVINSYVVDDENMEDTFGYEIIHDCNVSGGMSGGPLVDSRGKLIGINGLGHLPIINQGFLGWITDSNYDDLQYNFSIDIWQLYAAVLFWDDEFSDNVYFDKNGMFYNFLPKLNYYEHKELYDWLEESALQENLDRNKINIFLDSVFIK